TGRHKRKPGGIEPRGTPRLAAELLRWQRSCGQLLQPSGRCMTGVKIPVLDRRPRESASVTDLSGAGGGPRPTTRRQRGRNRLSRLFLPYPSRATPPPPAGFGGIKKNESGGPPRGSGGCRPPPPTQRSLVQEG